MIENKTTPTNNKIEAPGQCINLNNPPNDVKENDNAPVINANFFICILFNSPTRKVFRFHPVFIVVAGLHFFLYVIYLFIQNNSQVESKVVVLLFV
jgi:hypothetical protein